MSYGPITVTSIAPADVESALKQATTNYSDSLAANDYSLDDAAAEGIAGGIEAAKAAVATGSLGSGPVNVTISGHANPGHVPVKGYANDFLQVTITSAATLPSEPVEAASTEATPTA